MTNHIKKYRSHYILVGVVSLFWIIIILAFTTNAKVRSIAYPICGNNIIEPTEVCDDGNSTNAGICNDSCSAYTSCGDGTVQNPDGLGIAESCDDGNQINGDSCPNTCQPAFCGDGFIETGTEQCDDGNNFDGDGCSKDCKTEAFCGDGNTDEGESCDDGNNSDGDGCSASCQVEVVLPVCGNGVIEPGEICDDGDSTDDGMCNAYCNNLTFCGDGVMQTTDGLNTPEECDDGNQSNDDSCLNSCVTALCGDGFIQIGTEQCDDGNKNNGDGCSVYCQIEAVAGVCGDGNIDSSEACDDGNKISGDGCSSTCQTETSEPVCGNGTTENGEICDDGNNTDAGLCNSTCTALTFCGDGSIQNPDGAGKTEQCDDGNQDNDDSCLNSCMTATCGDGFVLSGTEECDDGNKMNGDGCSKSCTIETSACVEPSVKITFNHIETFNVPGWKNQVVSGSKTFSLSGSFVVIPLKDIQKFQASLTGSFQIGWDGLGQDKHLRLGSMRQIQISKKDKRNYGIEMDYNVEFLGDVNIVKFNRMNTETGKGKVIFNDGKITYDGDRADGTHFITGNGPSDDWSKYFLDYKDCDTNPVYPPCDKNRRGFFFNPLCR